MRIKSVLALAVAAGLAGVVRGEVATAPSGGPVAGATTGPATMEAAVSDAQIGAWIKQLGDDDFATRDAATAKLRGVGKDALAMLEKAGESDDPEIVLRAKDLVHDIKEDMTGTADGLASADHADFHVQTVDGATIGDSTRGTRKIHVKESPSGVYVRVSDVVNGQPTVQEYRAANKEELAASSQEGFLAYVECMTGVVNPEIPDADQQQQIMPPIPIMPGPVMPGPILPGPIMPRGGLPMPQQVAPQQGMLPVVPGNAAGVNIAQLEATIEAQMRANGATDQEVQMMKTQMELTQRQMAQEMAQLRQQMQQAGGNVPATDPADLDAPMPATAPTLP